MTICYFTASGNCLYVARRIGGTLLSIPQLMRREKIEMPAVIQLLQPIKKRDSQDVFSTVIILIAIVMKISETDYPAITLVLWYFYIWFLYGTINVKAFWLDK